MIFVFDWLVCFSFGVPFTNWCLLFIYLIFFHHFLISSTEQWRWKPTNEWHRYSLFVWCRIKWCSFQNFIFLPFDSKFKTTANDHNPRRWFLDSLWDPSHRENRIQRFFHSSKTLIREFIWLNIIKKWFDSMIVIDHYGENSILCYRYI